MDENQKPLNREESIARLAKDIKGITFAMLTTTEADGSLRSRPMATQEAEFNGELWFFSRDNTGKVHEIEEEQKVNVAYAQPSDNMYISVSGVAEVVRDRAKIKELWTPNLLAWFPKGEDDPQIALIKVTIENAEVWDSTSSKVIQLFGMAKAVLTGKPHEGEGTRHERLDLKH